MKITKAHLDYYRQRMAPIPQWAAHVAEKERQVSVHELIDAHLTMPERRYDALSLVSILVSARKRGQLSNVLREISEQPGCLIRPERRAGYARRWLNRIKNRRKAVQPQ
jgi:hypothetical protein